MCYDMPDIFRRMKSGKSISRRDPDFHLVYGQFDVAGKIQKNRMKNRILGNPQNSQRVILQKDLGLAARISSVLQRMGLFLEFGENVFINSNVQLFDQRGTKICDGAMIGPGAKIMTSNHPTDTGHRRDIVSEPVPVKENAWVGYGAVILPEVTTGRTPLSAQAP